MVRTLPGKVRSENPKIVKFPKSEPFNRNFWKFRKGKSNGMEIHLLEISEKIGIFVYLARLCSFMEIPLNAIPFAIGNFRKCNLAGRKKSA